jgi:hypothetical protein
LPEHFLYPYAVEKKKVTQPLENLMENKRKKQKEVSLTIEIDKEVEKSSTLPILRGNRKAEVKSKSLLSFD